MEETLIKFASILISVASVLSIILTIILQVFKNAKVNKRNKLLEENNSDKDKEIDGLKSEIENINKYIEIIGTVIPQAVEFAEHVNGDGQVKKAVAESKVMLGCAEIGLDYLANKEDISERIENEVALTKSVNKGV